MGAVYSTLDCFLARSKKKFPKYFPKCQTLSFLAFPTEYNTSVKPGHVKVCHSHVYLLLKCCFSIMGWRWTKSWRWGGCGCISKCVIMCRSVSATDVFLSVCLCVLDNVLTATRHLPQWCARLYILPTCNSPLESDCTAPPLLSNERIRSHIFVTIPCWGFPFLSLSLLLLLSHSAAFIGLCGLIEYLLACWHMQSTFTHAPKQPLNAYIHPHMWAHKLYTHKQRDWKCCCFYMTMCR